MYIQVYFKVFITFFRIYIQVYFKVFIIYFRIYIQVYLLYILEYTFKYILKYIWIYFDICRSIMKIFNIYILNILENIMINIFASSNIYIYISIFQNIIFNI